MDDAQKTWQIARDALASWQLEIEKNCYTENPDYIHTLQYQLGKQFSALNPELKLFGAVVTKTLEPLVNENNLAINLPRLNQYDSFGNRIDKVIHHSAYIQAGDLIYQTKLLGKLLEPNGLTPCLAFLFLSAHAGEAGHNCPIACSAGIIRVLQKVEVPDKEEYLKKLTASSFQTNFTGAQFLTEIQGGSDVGLNATYAKQNADKAWQIYGEKWFCSNANADLIFVIARYDQQTKGTRGLGLFLVPAIWNGLKNQYTINRLKDKIGTQSMATAEIDFNGAYAIPVGSLDEGFHLVMDNVLHLSRLFNSVCVLGMARRAYDIAYAYACHRVAFNHPIVEYPLVIENLAQIKAENAALMAGIFATATLQDNLDSGLIAGEDTKLLLRLLVNIQKYLTARLSVQHVHHCLDVLAGNGAIETFSSIPRLLRDCIVCENWEGTHNVLRMQVLKDMLKYNIDQIYGKYMQTEIAKLKTTTHKLFLQQEMEKLTQELLDFRQLSAALQTLQIRLIIDRMAILFCALMLCFEALDEENNKSGNKKSLYLDYFLSLHVNSKAINYDAAYMTLISTIIKK